MTLRVFFLSLPGRTDAPEPPMEPVSSAWPLLQLSRRYSNPPLSWAPSHPFLLQVGLGAGHVGAWMGALVESGIGSVLELVRDPLRTPPFSVLRPSVDAPHEIQGFCGPGGWLVAL